MVRAIQSTQCTAAFKKIDDFKVDKLSSCTGSNKLKKFISQPVSQCWRCARFHTLSPVPFKEYWQTVLFFANILVRSLQTIFIVIIKDSIYRIKVSKNCSVFIYTKKSLVTDCVVCSVTQWVALHSWVGVRLHCLLWREMYREGNRWTLQEQWVVRKWRMHRNR